MEELKRQVSEIDRKVSSVIDQNEPLSNNSRRAFYSQLEFIRLESEEWLRNNDYDSSIEAITILSNKIDNLESKLDLQPLNRKTYWWSPLDSIFRGVSLAAGIITVGTCASLPIVFLKVIEGYLRVDAMDSVAEMLRRQAGLFFLHICGIHINVIGIDIKNFKESCVLLTFSHASNIDGFIVAGTCPTRHCALAKKELFVIPFFSWISLAVGGIPVDRNNRKRALKALKRSSDAATNNNIAIVIAPEGTRSTTGHLLQFKKGAFYMWEQLRCPIVPVVSVGAFELFPPRSWINSTGKVTVKYLPPIMPDEATTRDEMLRLLRRRMLACLAEPIEGDVETYIKSKTTVAEKEKASLVNSGPNAAVRGQDLTWPERLYSMALSIALLAFDALVVNMGRYFLRDLLGLSITGSIALLVTSCGVITASLYVYNVYLVGSGPKSAVDKSDGEYEEQNDAPIREDTKEE